MSKDASFKLPGVVQFLYNHNPFYLLSTCLVLYGLQAAFHPLPGELIDPWALLAALSGYTVMCAITAYLIVKLGKVWEDARSLILILLFLFLALSVSFDEIVNTTSHLGRALLFFGFCLSVGISEWLITGLNIRLPWLYRGPFYLMLAIFFGYPLWVSPEVTELSTDVLRRRIMLFPGIAAVPFLLLIPAVRRGKGYTLPNGTPWRWPWVPWPMFAFLALAVCARSYVLSISFDPAAGMNSSFGVYALVPFLLAGMVLLLEIAMVHKSALLRRLVMAAGLLVLLLGTAIGDGSPVSRKFLDELIASAGSPLFLTAVGLVGFYAYAWIRGVKFGEWGCIGMLSLLVFIEPASLRFGEANEPQIWALQAIGLLEFFVAMIRSDSKRCFAGVSVCIAALALSPHPSAPRWMEIVVSYHLMLTAILVIGATYSDLFAKFLRKLGAVLLPMSGMFLLGIPLRGDFSEALPFAYLAMLAFAAGLQWWLTRERWYLIAGGFSVGMIGFQGSLRLWETLVIALGPKALYPLAAGAMCFLIAAGISALKAGAGTKFIASRKRRDPGNMAT